MSFPKDDSRKDAPAKAPVDFRVDQTQDEFDRDFFGRILQVSDRNSDVLRRQAELLARDGDYFAALDLDLVLAERFPGDAVVHYNLTCSLSMTGHLESALKTLRRAIELGYRDYGHIEADSDLDPLRDHPAYHELVRRSAMDTDGPHLC